MADYVSASVVTALRSSLNLGVFWRLGSDPALHLWMGVNDVPIGIPSLDAGGTVYIGAGRLLGVPDLEMLVNGIADKVEFGLSGVTAEHLAQVEAGAPPVRGALCTVGFAPLDARYQPVTQIIPLWQGTADYWAMEQQPADDPREGPKRTIMLSVGAGDTSRAIPKLVSFTGPYQRLLSATDAFCDRVSRYVQSYMVSWPRFVLPFIAAAPVAIEIARSL